MLPSVCRLTLRLTRKQKRALNRILEGNSGLEVTAKVTDDYLLKLCFYATSGNVSSAGKCALKHALVVSEGRRVVKEYNGSGRTSGELNTFGSGQATHGSLLNGIADNQEVSRSFSKESSGGN